MVQDSGGGNGGGSSEIKMFGFILGESYTSRIL